VTHGLVFLDVSGDGIFLVKEYISGSFRRHGSIGGVYTILIKKPDTVRIWDARYKNQLQNCNLGLSGKETRPCSGLMPRRRWSNFWATEAKVPSQGKFHPWG